MGYSSSARSALASARTWVFEPAQRESRFRIEYSFIIDPTLPVERQLIVMCAVTVVIAGLLDAAWGVAAGYGRAFLMKPKQNLWLGRISGLVLIGGGIWLSLQRRPV